MAKYKSPAIRSYLLRLIVLMTIYMITLFTAVTMFNTGAVSGIAAYALAIAPALPIIGVFWAVMRLLIEEPDEFIKLLHVRQCLCRHRVLPDHHDDMGISAKFRTGAAGQFRFRRGDVLVHGAGRRRAL